ncbi:Na+/H+ antiporter NhaC family protein [Dorea sp. AF36-15AT]|uniref:Na+/H+ antiporter NhaC family protein n=1 Tax=Dorea sp. AF36-15AT TaxID=2292041 RepID=UPI001314A583|nr:Na+/H+ antiporter NhaC family protein [Dorea sp. AF36-15AT]
MEKKKASLTLSSLAIVLIVAFIAVGIGVFNVNIAILLFLCWMIMWPFAAHLGYSFSEMEGFAYEMAQKCIAPAAIILAVGMMIASFMAAGTVPTILVAGLKLITPKFFLALTFVMCCIMSVIMGTSWGTLGTVGIAMMGVGAGLGVNPAITAGAVVSGAWFGDKMSPMSDSTIMCSTITETYIMDHIKAMMQTTIPAAVVSLVIYLGIGIGISGDSYDASTVDSIMNGLKGMFHINLIPVIPIVVVIVMILMKKGTIVSMMSGTVVAILIAVFYQGYSVADMGTFLYSGFTCETKNEILISLLNRGGMTSMLSLLAVFVGGLGLGGILDKTGMLEPIFHYITEKYKSPRGIMLMAWCATLLCILVIADNNFAFVMVATLFGSAFQKYNLKSQNLSRILEDVGTLGSALVPWNVGAQFAAGVLGVSTLAYMPYAFLNWMTPILSLAFIILQVKIKKIEE